MTSTAKDLENFDKKNLSKLLDEAIKKLQDDNSNDKEKYIMSYKIETLRQINQ